MSKSCFVSEECNRNILHFSMREKLGKNVLRVTDTFHCYKVKMLGFNIFSKIWAIFNFNNF